MPHAIPLPWRGGFFHRKKTGWLKQPTSNTTIPTRILRKQKTIPPCPQPQIPRSEPQPTRPQPIPTRSEEVPIRSVKVPIRCTTYPNTFIRSPTGLSTSPMGFSIHPDTLHNLSRQVKDRLG